MNRVRSLSGEVRNGFRGQSRPFIYVLGATLLLVGVGLLMVASASSVDALKTSTSAFTPFRNQAIAAGIGFAGLLALQFFSWERLTKFVMLGMVFSISLQIVTVLTAASVNGNKNWLRIGNLFTLQPSELIKIALILFLAVKLKDLSHPDTDVNTVWLHIFGATGISLFLVVIAGEDLGTGIVMGLIVLGMFLLAGVDLTKISLLVLLVAGAAVSAVLLSPNRMARVMIWLDPTLPDPLDLRWQTTHASWAFAEGGLTGTGLGQSKLKWNWIPEIENDFIFAVVGEEAGLGGALVVLGIYVFLAIALFRVAKAQFDFGAQLFVSGVMIWIFMQSMVNIGVVLGIFPVLGVTLPLMSQGGTSMVANLVAIGMVLGIEKHRFQAEVRGYR